MEGEESRGKGRSASGPGSPGAPGLPATFGRAGGSPRSFSEAQRKALLEELERGGESIPAFARRVGVSACALRRWRTQRSPQKAPSPPSAGRGPRAFSFEERKAAVEGFAKAAMTQQAFARLYGVTETTLSKWLRRYREGGAKALETRLSPLTGRGRKKRLAEPVREEVLSVQRRFPDFGLRRVRDFLWRFSGLHVSTGSVNRIRAEAGLGGAAPPKRRRKPPLPRRFERSRPGDLWQSDITSYLLTRHSQRVYLTVFLDDFSRYVVSWRLELQQRSDLVTGALLEGISRFGKPKEVLTDQGRQYFAWRGKSEFQRVLEREGIAHVVARTHHPQTLGKCERLWETIGRELWERAHPQALSDARERLEHFFAHYNHHRPHQGLEGLVPADRFFGAEREVRAAIERALERNELALALGERPRKPVFLVGQIGERQLSLHGEQGRLVVQTDDGQREELRYEELGALAKGREQGDERDDDDGDGGDDDGRRRRAAAAKEAAPALGKASELSALAAGAALGAGAVGGGERGGEEPRSHGVCLDPGVVAREDLASRAGRASGSGADPGVAALAAGARGDGGGAAAPATDAPAGDGAAGSRGSGEDASRGAGAGSEGARWTGETGGAAAGIARTSSAATAELEEGARAEGDDAPAPRSDGGSGSTCAKADSDAVSSPDSPPRSA